MSRYKFQTAKTTAGHSGTGVRVGHEWTGWKQNVCHPQAPDGAGGPGNFAARTPLNLDAESDLPSPRQPGAIGVEPLAKAADKPKPPNPPPLQTAVLSLGVLEEISAEFVDCKIEAEILADVIGGVEKEAVTDFTKPSLKAPQYDSSADGKILKFRGKFTFKGAIQIQTKYASEKEPGGLSCYGRGTTKTDVKNRDITLGFHESCHRADYEDYLNAHVFPNPPAMSIGMRVVDYEKQTAAFVKALNQYWEQMKAYSIQKTDEVGFTLSEWNQTGNCYTHLLP